MDFERSNSQQFSRRLREPRANPTRTLTWQHNHNDRNTNAQTRGVKEQFSLQSMVVSMCQHAPSRADTNSQHSHSTWCEGKAQLFRTEFRIAFITKNFFGGNNFQRGGGSWSTEKERPRTTHVNRYHIY